MLAWAVDPALARQHALAITGFIGGCNIVWRPALRDADNDMMLETAKNDGVDAVGTLNKRDFLHVAKRLGIAARLPKDAAQAISHAEKQLCSAAPAFPPR